MERNPNSWRLLAMLFSLAMLFALGQVNASTVAPERPLQYEIANSPPGQVIIAIDQTSAIEFAQPTAQIMICIDRGVSVPYKGLIKSDAQITNDTQKFECNIYYTISQIDLKPDILAGYRNEIDKYPFAADLGLRYTSSVNSVLQALKESKLNMQRGANTRLTDFKLMAEK